MVATKYDRSMLIAINWLVLYNLFKLLYNISMLKCIAGLSSLSKSRG